MSYSVKASSAVDRSASFHESSEYSPPVINNITMHAPAKRALDILCAASGLVVLSPLLLGVTVSLYISGGQPIFQHPRVGQHGKLFPCYKFRSMVRNNQAILEKHLASNPAAAAEWAATHKLRHDPRVTRFGRFLRKTSIDELPQLWNVLCGHMSMVGPRPVVAAELTRYGNDSGYYLAVRPGITGLWQVNGRSDTTYEERVAMDKYYVQTRTFWTDIVLMAKTLRVFIKSNGAY